MEPIILGIDPGTRITGFGLIRTNLEPIDFGCIRPPAKLPLQERYRILFDAVEQLLDKHKPSAVVVESQFVLHNAQSAIKLGMAKGMVILAAARRGIEVFEYAPTKAKLSIVGTGSASKAQVQRMVAALLRLPTLPEPEDAADALALAICHINNQGKPCSSTLKARSSKKTRKKWWLKREESATD